MYVDYSLVFIFSISYIGEISNGPPLLSDILED